MADPALTCFRCPDPDRKRRCPAWFSRLLALLALLLAASAAAQQAPARVLFIGNSLTYVGNLPAVFDALSQANDRPTASDIPAQDGATLTQRLNDGSAAPRWRPVTIAT